MSLRHTVKPSTTPKSPVGIHMLFTCKYLWRMIQKTTTDTIKVSESNACSALLFGFFTITLCPIIAALFIFDQLFYLFANYVVPLVGIIFMLFIGFPLLKLLQYVYFSIIFVWNTAVEYVKHWQCIVTHLKAKLNDDVNLDQDICVTENDSSVL